MVSAAVLGSLAGFFGALITLGVPVGKVLVDVHRDASKAVRLLTGEDETEGDGVIPRLRTVEETTDEVVEAVDEAETVPFDAEAVQSD